MKIYCESSESMTAVVAGLVKEGLTFEVREKAGGAWVITLTGGY